MTVERLTYLCCLACGHRVYGATLLRCPKCGCAMELRWSRPLPGDGVEAR